MTYAKLLGSIELLETLIKVCDKNNIEIALSVLYDCEEQMRKLGGPFGSLRERIADDRIKLEGKL